MNRPRLLRTLLITALLMAAATLSACRRGSEIDSFPGAPVILISIDTLRADHLPPWGHQGVETPAIEGLARDGVVFLTAYSPVPLTLPSHTTMFSGLVPPNHGVRDNSGYDVDADKHFYLPRQLSAAGYSTGGFVSSYVLRADTGISAGFDTYDCDVEPEQGVPLEVDQRPGAETAELAVAWLREHAGEPFFLFFHLWEPHFPWLPPEPYKSRYPASAYDAEIATADAAVGVLLEELRTLGIYDRALILLLADHGEGLGEHGEQQHGVMLYRNTLHVPLIVKLPGQARAGTRVESPVGLVDVAPTVLALAGIQSEATFDGRSLFSPPDPARELYAESYHPRLHYGWSDLKAVYDAHWSLIDGPTPELFDLDADPGQEHNVLLDNRREVARLRATVAKWDRPLSAPEAVDAETAARLTALGYLSGPALNSAESRLPDPRSQRHLLRPIEEGTEALAAERWDEAEKNFRQVLDQNPDMYDLWLALGRSLEKQGKAEEAVAAAKRALALSGGNSDLALGIARSQLSLEHFDDAWALAESVRASQPKESDDLLVQIALAAGKRDQAQQVLDEAERAGRLTERMAYRLALQRVAEGQPQRAIDLLQPFGDDVEPLTLVARGRALSDVGRQQEALATLERARRTGEPFAELHEALGIVLLRLDRSPEARRELEHALSMNDQLVESWNTLGVALFRLEGPRAAMAAWKRAIALDPDQYEALFNLGLVAAQAGDLAEARRALRGFIAHAPVDRFGDDIARARAALAQLGG